MFKRSQWINWELINNKKIPCQYKNPHNPEQWMSYEKAKSISSRVAFVLTDGDPYFCIDLDNQYNDGKWSDLSVDVVKMFKGAYVETSASGTGLHIFARAKISPNYMNRNNDLGLEVYDHKRLICVTGAGAYGNPDVDMQAPLSAFLQKYMPLRLHTMETGKWRTSPVEDWSGPENDDDLLALIRRRTKTGNNIWDGKATPAQLFDGDVEALSNSYPTIDDRPFDYSSADYALAAHLAFYTGNNCDRVERLMYKSALKRDKWDNHKSYLKTTILKACSGKNVLKSTSRQVNTDQTKNTDKSIFPYGTIIHIDLLPKFFDGCVYIEDTVKVLVPDGSLLNKEQFENRYSHYEFAATHYADKFVKSAWDVFVKSKTHDFPKVKGIIFRPEMDFMSIIDDRGFKYVNTYKPYQIPENNGDVSLFLDVVGKLFPDDNDRQIILSYMAACVQYRGKKFQWSPVIQGTYGNGKSFLTQCMVNAIGEKYSHIVNPVDIASRFNSWLQGKLFVGVEEVHMGDKREVEDMLKIMITNTRIEIQAKRENQYMGDNRANFIMNTNYKNAIKKTADDRRYCIFYTPQQSKDDLIKCGMDENYFYRLYTWAERENGYNYIATYLNNYDIPDTHNPTIGCVRAPVTTSTAEAIAHSASPIEQEIREAEESGKVGFRNGWLSMYTFNQLLKQMGGYNRMSLIKKVDLLNQIGYVKVGRAKNPIIQENGEKPLLFSRSSVGDDVDVTKEYILAQRYIYE